MFIGCPSIKIQWRIVKMNPVGCISRSQSQNSYVLETYALNVWSEITSPRTFIFGKQHYQGSIPNLLKRRPRDFKMALPYGSLVYIGLIHS